MKRLYWMSFYTGQGILAHVLTSHSKYYSAMTPEENAFVI